MGEEDWHVRAPNPNNPVVFFGEICIQTGHSSAWLLLEHGAVRPALSSALNQM